MGNKRERERERTRLSKWDGRVLFQIRGKRKPIIWHQLLSFRKVEGAFSLPGGGDNGKKKRGRENNPSEVYYDLPIPLRTKILGAGF